MNLTKGRILQIFNAHALGNDRFNSDFSDIIDLALEGLAHKEAGTREAITVSIDLLEPYHNMPESGAVTQLGFVYRAVDRSRAVQKIALAKLDEALK